LQSENLASCAAIAFKSFIAVEQSLKNNIHHKEKHKMAWIGIQDSALTKLKRLSFLSQMTRAQVFCALADLWHGTQTEFIAETTKEEILFFSLSSSDETFSIDQKEKFFDALIKLNFITPNDDALYKINGNSDHIAKIKSAKLKSAKGHDAKRQKKLSTKPTKTKQELLDKTLPGAIPEALREATPEALPDSDTDSDSDSVPDSSLSLERERGKREKKTAHSSSVPPPPEFLKLFEIWNAECRELSKALKPTQSRQNRMRERWKENPSLEFWTRIVKKMAESSFCNGNNERGWKADFDFLLKPDTFAKVLEGKYENKEKKKNTYLDGYADDFGRHDKPQQAIDPKVKSFINGLANAKRF
jgi:hypothetical protein